MLFNHEVEMLVNETNAIEGIDRDATQEEKEAFLVFMALDKLTVSDVCAFVGVFQPGAMIRTQVGLNVRVGTHSPPDGGPHIYDRLHSLLLAINANDFNSWEAHVKYESLHPFSDGNGRSGRAIWCWHRQKREYNGRFRLIGFLHDFYYQTLENKQ